MKVDKSALTGVVLAGGKSSRMGQDKGLMLLHGKPMIAHILEQLKPCAGQIIIVANQPAYEQFGYSCVPDLVKDAGPVGGIYTGLMAAPTDLAFFISCDMPFITPAAIRLLLDSAGSTAITVASLQGQMQPLFGLYSKYCLPLFKQHLQEGKLRLQALVKETGPTVVPLDSLTARHPQLLQNINTPAEFNMALQHNHLWN